MRIGIISDIHANLPALEAVLKELDSLKVDEVYCLGDTVGYGPFPAECVTLVRSRCSVVLKGNHDSGLIGETSLREFNQFGQKAISWSQKRVDEEQRAYLRSLPLTVTEKGVTFTHASPRQPSQWEYILTARVARENFGAFTTNLCFIGHTHVPVIIGEDGSVNRYVPGNRYIINVGSVGQPRDGNPDAAFGLYDADAAGYSLMRVPYEVDRTARAIGEAGLPDFLAKRLFNGI